MMMMIIIIIRSWDEDFPYCARQLLSNFGIGRNFLRFWKPGATFALWAILVQNIGQEQTRKKSTIS